MAANNDNAMARFLFAILRQKCLKDIDWNKVASDPVLLQPISNGHAARMRYSRFRSTMLGIEPQRRNRTTAGNTRVAKTKKDKDTKHPKDAKKDKRQRTGDDESLDDAPGASDQELPSALSVGSASSGNVKHESQPRVSEGHKAARSPATTSGMFPDNHVHFQNRLMTPCSDSDAIMAHHGYAGSPNSEMLQQEPFDFPTSAHCGTHERGAWHHHSPTYPTFGMTYELDGYSGGFSEHSSPQHHHHPHEQSQGLCVPAVVMNPDPGHVSVKNEPWDSQYHAV